MTEETQAPERDTQGRFQKGSSGNPSGRPKGGGPLVRRFRDILESPPTLEMCIEAGDVLNLRDEEAAALCGRFETFGDLLAHVTALRALRGTVDFLREIGDRVDPKPRRVEVSGPGGGPMRGTISSSQSEEERDAAANYMDDLDGDN